LEEDIPTTYALLHIDKDIALERLKTLSGQDFGYDGQRWRQWLTENGYIKKIDPYNGLKV